MTRTRPCSHLAMPAGICATLEYGVSRPPGYCRSNDVTAAEGQMDEELTGQAPDHEPVPDDAAVIVTERARAAIEPGRMPGMYLGHGAPPLVDDPLWVVQLEAWARALPRPTAILVVSAHWDYFSNETGAT